tara:strand:- start:1072 stop:1581 length:510 start_codon:yes stop_codon:yes gene_type:complete
MEEIKHSTKMRRTTEMSKRFLYLCSLLCLIFVLQACAPSRNVRGNNVDVTRLSELELGQSNKDDVVSIIGSPTSKAAFNDNIWYYIGLETVKQGFLDPKIENKQVYIASFDENEMLSSFQKLDAKSEDIPIQSRKTPTHGKNLTLIEQFIGNVGRFNSALGDQEAQLER